MWICPATLLSQVHRKDAQHNACRWHWEMAQLNVVVRTLIRVMWGTALPPGTHADALLSYNEAVRLNPNRLVHRWADYEQLTALSLRIVAQMLLSGEAASKL